MSRKKKKKNKNRRLNFQKPSFHIPKVENLVGVSLTKAKKGEKVSVQTRGSYISDEPLFYTLIEQLSNIFLKKQPVNSINQFLVLIRKDNSADIYINDISMIMEIMAKGAIGKGEAVYLNKIADIKKISFRKMQFNNTDKIVFCFKVGWKFGLFFDLVRNDEFTNYDIEKEIGSIYRHLYFQNIYDTVYSSNTFSTLIKDGWFPFLELIPIEYKQICDSYEDEEFDITTIDNIVNKFDNNRINSITDRWWGNELFNSKKSLLQAGVNAFLQNTEEGFINSIKTLLTELEGIIRICYFQDKGRSAKITTLDLINYITQKGISKTESKTSLILPDSFFTYLKDSIFQNFDLESDDTPLSRHSCSHGVAKSDDYTKIRALQIILTLDQMHFYL